VDKSGASELLRTPMDNGTPPKEEQAAETVAENQAHRSTDLVRVEDVTKTFGSKTAVKGVSFSVPAG
jgi:ATPase subunit of ABC transporter with duplicated ATPase domains